MGGGGVEVICALSAKQGIRPSNDIGANLERYI